MSNAFSQSMHGSNPASAVMQMQHTNHQEPLSQSSTAQSASPDPHCMQMDTAQQADPTTHQQPSLSCQSSSMDAAMTQGHCDHCNMSLCQSAAAWIHPSVTALDIRAITAMPVRIMSDYSAQHLAGYWQQILRPPKA
ncbi:hypothetical protein EC844_1515 [Acinetobacter calcoaceticus]|uniref:DUF2946 domain-containing protein n=1 Tax=Acinetobacter calcoaceticus TaxID=471 RepID=A0A4R1X8V6_ACICA|nr:hypothetical protein EC844_1515 [Acinetobacter calcoaceticus]